MIRVLWFALLMLVTLQAQALQNLTLDLLGVQSNGNSASVAVSHNGRFIAFDSFASNLIPGTSSPYREVFFFDRQTKVLELISVDINGQVANGHSTEPSISDDGRYVVFTSMADLTSGSNANGNIEVYVRDRLTHTTRLVSSNSSGVAANGYAIHPRISADGQLVVFESTASNLSPLDTNLDADVFLKHLDTGQLELISKAANGRSTDYSYSGEPNISSNGRYVVFTSIDGNILSPPIASQHHVYMYDRQTGTMRLVSANSSGVAADGSSFMPSVDDSGRYVVFYSLAGNLAAGAVAGRAQVYLHDMLSGATTMLSRGADGSAGNDHSYYCSISSGGGYAIFASFAGNLLANGADNNGYGDIYVSNLRTGELRLISRANSGALSNDNIFGPPAIDADGGVKVFSSYASNLVANDNNGYSDVFIDDVPPNSPPVAVAGGAQSLECTGPTTDVTLDGRGSYDVDGDALSYLWSGDFGQTSGAVVTVPMTLGSHAVSLSVDDGRGAQSSASTSVSIHDSVAPSVSLPTLVTVEAQTRNGASYTVNPMTSDLCSAVGVAISPTDSSYPLGDTNVTVTATDSSGNSSSANEVVRVVDTTPPVFQSVPPAVVDEATAVLTPVTLTPASATDIFDVSVSSNAPLAFPLGTTQVTWTAIDSNGNAATASQQVTIRDTTPPTLSAPTDIVAEANAVNSTVALGSPISSDIFPVSISNNAPATFPLGTTQVVWKATDSSGNTSTATQQVSVRDTTPPVLTPPADMVVEAVAPLTPITLSQATATDIFPVTIANNAQALYPLGTTLVTWTATDSNGNVSTAQQRVTVVDTTPPDMQFDQLHTTLWPPNNRMREVARVSNVHDLVDPNPGVNIDVQVQDIDDDHDHHAQAKGRNDARHGREHRFPRRDWKVVQANGVWHIYVRARMPERDGVRRYDITVTATDASGNSRQASAQVSVRRPDRSRHPDKGHHSDKDRRH